MMPDKRELDFFKLRARLTILENLALRLALEARVSSQGLSIQDSQRYLEEWLETNAEEADRVYGKFFEGKPAMTALYAEAFREVIEELKERADRIASTSGLL